MPRDIDYVMQWNKSYYDNHTQQEKDRVKARRMENAKFVQALKIGKTCNFKDKCKSLIKYNDNDNDNVHDSTNDSDDSRDDFNPDIKLEFHHKDPNNKFKEISLMVYQGYSLKRILAEIDKCVLVCRECHKFHFHPHLCSTPE